MTSRDSQSSGSRSDESVPGAIERGIDRILAAAATSRGPLGGPETGDTLDSGPQARATGSSAQVASQPTPEGLTRALFESLRGFASVKRITLWRSRNSGAGPLEHVRSLGLPTPTPEEISGPHWSAPGFSVLSAGPFGALVLETVPGTGPGAEAQIEEEIDGIECLLTLCASVCGMDAMSEAHELPQRQLLEEVHPALPASPPDAPAEPSPSATPQALRHSDGESRSDGTESGPITPRTNPDHQDRPESGDSAA